MCHSDHSKVTDTNLPSDKHFGIFTLVISVMGFILCFFWLNEFSISLIFAALALALTLTLLIKESLFHPLNRAWFKFGIFLGKILNPIILGVIYLSLFLPVGLLLKLVKRDELQVKKFKYNTHWKSRSTNEIDENNFRQQF